MILASGSVSWSDLERMHTGLELTCSFPSAEHTFPLQPSGSLNMTGGRNPIRPWPMHRLLHQPPPPTPIKNDTIFKAEPRQMYVYFEK